MAANELQTLAGPELMDLAEEYAVSESATEHEQLLAEMKAKDFLDRLDPNEGYERPPMQLALARIIRMLAENRSPSARAGLLGLTRAPDFTMRWQCNELLIVALVNMRPAPIEAVDYWRRHSQAEALHRHSAMQAVCQNASAPAMPVLHDALTNPQHPQKERVGWMRDPVLANRCQPEVLDTCERLLTGALQPDLRSLLVEALFDYQPRLWYRACSPPAPPGIEEWTPEGREKYRQLGRLVLDSIPIGSGLKRAVQLSIEAVGPD